MLKKEILVSASVYNKKYFLNKKYSNIPKNILEQLKNICIILSEKLHCIFSIGFYENGNIFFESKYFENDINYDEIGSKLEIDKLIKKEKKLIYSLELWYKVFILKDISNIKNNLFKERAANNENRKY